MSAFGACRAQPQRCWAHVQPSSCELGWFLCLAIFDELLWGLGQEAWVCRQVANTVARKLVGVQVTRHQLHGFAKVPATMRIPFADQRCAIYCLCALRGHPALSGTSQKLGSTQEDVLPSEAMRVEGRLRRSSGASQPTRCSRSVAPCGWGASGFGP